MTTLLGSFEDGQYTFDHSRVRRICLLQFATSIFTKAPHEEDWRNDVRDDRDVFVVGSLHSWVVSADGPEVTPELIDCLRSGISWKGKATIGNPLTENAIGKHVLLIGEVAEQE